MVDSAFGQQGFDPRQDLRVDLCRPHYARTAGPARQRSEALDALQAGKEGGGVERGAQREDPVLLRPARLQPPSVGCRRDPDVELHELGVPMRVHRARRVAGQLDADGGAQQLHVGRRQPAARQVQDVARLPPAPPGRRQLPQYQPRGSAAHPRAGLFVVRGRPYFGHHLPQLREQVLPRELLVPDPPRPLVHDSPSARRLPGAPRNGNQTTRHRHTRPAARDERPARTPGTDRQHAVG